MIPRSAGWLEFHAWLTAGQFLTRLPLPGGASHHPDIATVLLARAVKYFPLWGGLIAAITASVIVVASLAWPLPIAVALALLVEAVVTGGFHEDAVADSCDAFGGGWTREDIQRILKDSRIGSFGALGLGLAVLLRWSATVATFESWSAVKWSDQPMPTVDATLFAMGPVVIVVSAAGAIGRFAIVSMMSLVNPPAEHRGLSKDIEAPRSWTRWIGALVLVAPWWLACCWISWPLTVAGSVGVAVVVGWLAAYFQSRLGGVTGDCLGATAYAAQVVWLLAFASRVNL